MLGFKLVSNLGLYLGVPLLHGRSTNRVVLSQAVLSAIPYYTIQSARLPTAICEGLEKRCRRFVWGGSGGARKLSLVKWDEVCRARRDGGLGLKRQRLMNDALLMKLGWKFLTDHNALWIQVWKAKYGANPFSINHGRCSAVFQAVKKVWSHVVSGARWAVCNGRATRFWTDRWLLSGTVLLDIAVSGVPEQRRRRVESRTTAREATSGSMPSSASSLHLSRLRSR
ncbi:Unknown protein [Striga hermonthica]|uniref:Uncharacterized protein n=1 Tax=Striga hermonthica TaxID=68872 RepID=A0A9N7N041_STRHE|nr:Unknown protein [Striga hermonthica]